MTKILLLPTFILLLADNLFAQVRISGTVKDNKNHPVAGASITIKDSYDGATSDSSGAFSFRTTEEGEKNITVSSIGYNPFQQNVNIGKEPLKLVIPTTEKLDELKAVMV